jgi:hypothetical protein
MQHSTHFSLSHYFLNLALATTTVEMEKKNDLTPRYKSPLHDAFSWRGRRQQLT